MSAELRSLIRKHAAALPDADPREIAKHVAADTRRADLPGFFEEVLSGYVAGFLRGSRNSMLDKVGEPWTPSPPSSKPRPANASPKLRDIRDGFARLCSERVHIGHSQWKTLGECGLAELNFCIAEREQEIIGVQAQIENYLRLVALLKKHKVKTIAQLPPAAVFP